MEKIRKGDVVVIKSDYFGGSLYGELGIVKDVRGYVPNLVQVVVKRLADAYAKIERKDAQVDEVYLTQEYLEVIDHIEEEQPKEHKANLGEDAVQDYTQSPYDTELKQNFIFLKDGNKYTAQLFGSRIIIGCGHCNQVVKEVNLEDLI
jgi:hypothetical protein